MKNALKESTTINLIILLAIAIPLLAMLWEYLYG